MMKNFTKHVQNTNALYGLWNRGDTIVVGVSGGRDSMCLLHVLLRIASKEGLIIVVAHVNYNLRGEESIRDQKIVEDFCVKNELTCETHILPSNANGKTEADWREIRRNFFAQVASRHCANSIALGHHVDDQAETLLLHLLRGSGLQGLANMRFRSEQILSLGAQEVKKTMNTIIRPLLNVGRDDISAYCDDNQISYGEDASNSSTIFLRNKVRHELIPYLKEHYNQEITTTLARSARIMGDDYAFLEESVLPEFTQSESRVTFSRSTFSDLSPAAQRFFLRHMIQKLTITQKSLGFGIIEEVRKAVYSTKNKNQKIRTNDLIFCVKNATVEITLAS